MSQGKTLYFSPAEFLIMLELAGETPCALLRSGAMPDEGELTQAFVSLFQRGLILRTGDSFAVSGPGRMFAHIRNSPWAVFLSGKQPYESAAVCYVEEELLWLVELADVIVSRQYRVRPLERANLREWLFDSGFLERPVLKDADAGELGEFFADELAEVGGRVLLRLEKYVNGGPLLVTHEVRKGRSGCLICSRDEVEREVTIYTEEALSRMLADCFGKGEYGL